MICITTTFMDRDEDMICIAVFNYITNYKDIDI
jgi:hypothetical protein